jgi:hypothetical protein
MKVEFNENLMGILTNFFLDIQTRVKQAVFRLARRIPYVQRQIAKARDDSLKSIYADMVKSTKGHTFAYSLPEQGLSKVSERF